MKVKTKDEIITCLIDMLSLEINDNLKYRAIEQGWIEALKWVLGLINEEVSTKEKNTLVVKERENNE